MVVDISFLTYFAPILAFLIVFVVMFAILAKTELIGNNQFAQIFVSFLVASIFVAAAGVREYVLTITPWVAFLLISLLFIFIIMGLVGKDIEFLHKGIGIFFVIVVIIVFLVSGYIIFSSYLSPYFTEEFLTSRIGGAALLLIICAIVSWILVRK